jgi:hypothetical protein
VDLTNAKKDFARKAVLAFCAGDRGEARRLFSLAQEQGPQAILSVELSPEDSRECTQLAHDSYSDRRNERGEEDTLTDLTKRKSEKFFTDGRPQLVSTQDWHRAAQRVLEWVTLQYDGGDFRIDQPYIPTYGLVAIAACCRAQRKNPALLSYDYLSPSASFAQAIGIHNTISTSRSFVAAEAERTVPLGRVLNRSQVASMAGDMSTLVVPGPEGKHLREVVNYSLVELLRNVVQHSSDPLGGVAAAQMIAAEHGPGGMESVQIAVADMGAGIESTLSRLHPDISGDALAAINKAIRPRISGTFKEGEFGSEENAGLGLFFLTRITKLLRGRFLIASRGASLSAAGVDSQGHLQQRSLGVDFPGTLAVFEIPREIPAQFQTQQGIIEFIREHELPAMSIDKSKAVYWIRMCEPAEGERVHRVLVSVGGRDFGSIRRLVETSVLPSISQGVAVAMDFVNVTLLTDSMAHELVGLAVREAYQKQVPVYALNTTPAIARTLVFVQGYLLADLAPRRKRRR